MNKIWYELPVIRGYAHETVPYHVGSVWENRLGGQVIRTIGQYSLCKLRRLKTRNANDEISDILKRDGIAVIKDFLSDEDFAQVRTEFDRAVADRDLKPYKNAENASLYRTQIPVSGDCEEFPATIRWFQHNELLNRIVSTSLGRTITRPPNVHFDMYKRADQDGIDNDIENILHADLNSSTIKMFYYLSEVDEQNSAFVYAKGSHSLTFARLRHEYELSVRQARLKKGLVIDDTLVSFRGNEIRNNIHPRYLRAMQIRETHICAKPNTLVIADNMGLHRRGEFSSDRPRKSIQINYRFLERPLFKDLFHALKRRNAAG